MHCSLLREQQLNTLGALLLVAGVLFSCPSLNAQLIQDVLIDDSPKQHTTIFPELGIDVGPENFYLIGRSSSECRAGFFTACIDPEGNEVWNTLNTDLQLETVRILRIIDGELFVGGIEQDEFKLGQYERLLLYKFDIKTGELLWQSRQEGPRPGNYIFGMQPYGDDNILMHSNSREPNARVVWIVNRESGQDISSTQIGLGNGSDLASDKQGDIYVNTQYQISKIDGANGRFQETIWARSLEDLEIEPRLQKVFKTENDRLYAITSAGTLLEINTLDGTVADKLILNGDLERSTLMSYRVEWPHLYAVWQGAANPNGIRQTGVSKVNLDELNELWLTSTDPEVNISFREIAQIRENGDLIATAVTSGNDIQANLSIIYLDGTDGSEKANNFHDLSGTASQNTTLFLSPFDNGKDIRLFGFQYETIAPYYYRAQIRILGLDENTLELSDKATFSGQARYASFVKSMHSSDDGSLLQLRQHGAVVEVVRLDANFQELWSTHLPVIGNLELALSLAVNDVGQIGVMTRPATSEVSRDYKYDPGFGNVPDPRVLHFFVLSPDGEILTDHEERAEPNYNNLHVNPQLNTSGNDFYALIGEGTDELAPEYILGINSSGAMRYTGPKGLPYAALAKRIVRHNDDLFILNSADNSSQNAAFYHLDPRTGETTVRAEWSELRRLLLAETFADGSAIVVGEHKDGTGEVIRFDLESGATIWRYSINSYHEAQIVKSDGNGKIYLAGNVYEEGFGSIRDLVISRVDESSGELDWRTLRSPEILRLLTPGEMVLNSGAVFMSGSVINTTTNTNQDGFLMYLDQSGNNVGFDILAGSRSVDLHLTLDKQVLHSVEEPIEGECYTGGAVYLVDQAVVGIQEGNQHTNVQLRTFPNPADSQVLLVFDGVEGQEYTLVVRDILGRKLMQTQARLANAAAGIHLSLDDIGSGIYGIEISGGGLRAQGMFTKR